MQTLFIIEYQAYNNGKCTATAPLGHTDETGLPVGFLQQMRKRGGQ